MRVGQCSGKSECRLTVPGGPPPSASVETLIPNTPGRDREFACCRLGRLENSMSMKPFKLALAATALALAVLPALFFVLDLTDRPGPRKRGISGLYVKTRHPD
jgi:hypothetical protein